MKKLLSILGLVLLLALMPACKFYSFTGANYPPYLESIQIEFFENKSNNGPADLSQDFTENLRDKFTSGSNLSLVNREGDVMLDGRIIGYVFINRAPTAGETSAINRLTITVEVDYTDTHDSKKSWKQQFSRFAEYESTQSLADIEDDLIADISEQLSQDIFNKALVNW